MSVLRRDIEAYQRALDQYQRQVAAYNSKIDAYNKSIVSDPSGNFYVVNNSGEVFVADKGSGKVTSATLPGGKKTTDYGVTSIEGDSNFRLLRQNPTQAKRDTVTGAFRGMEGGDEWGYGQTPYYYTLGDPVPDYEGGYYRPQVRLGSDYRVDKTIPGQMVGYGDGEYRTPDQYELSRDASTYAAKPAAFDKKFTKTAPDPTYAQLRQLQQGTANQQALAADRGLISEVMRGGGVLADRPQYAAFSQRTTPGVASTASQSMPTVNLLPVLKLPPNATPQDKAAEYNRLLAAGYSDAQIRIAAGPQRDSDWTTLQQLAADARSKPSTTTTPSTTTPSTNTPSTTTPSTTTPSTTTTTKPTIKPVVAVPASNPFDVDTEATVER